MTFGRLSVDVAVASSLARHLEFSPVAFAVTEGPDHVVRYANAAFREFQLSVDAQKGLNLVLDRSLVDGKPIRDELIAQPNSNATQWSCSVWPVPAVSSEPDGLMVEVRDVTAVEEERAVQRSIAERLLIGALREQDNARSATEATRRSSYLSMASRELAMSLDEDATRGVVQRRALPREGAWCIVDVVEPNGSIHRLGVVHPDPTKQALARDMVDHWYPNTDDPIGAPAIIRSGSKEALVIPEQTAIALVGKSHGEENLAVLRSLGFGALLIVPLIARAALLGTITFVSREGDRAVNEEEIIMAWDLADRCALALENARLFRETEALRVAADAANRAKSTFLGSMSHELRTPLNAIGGYVELLEMGLRGPVTPEQRLDLTRIKNNQQHLLKMITDILSFVRPESGQMKYTFAAVPVEPILLDVTEMLAGAAKGGTLHFERNANAPGAVVWADADRVRQIVLNLVMNAVKYTGDRGARITLGAVVRDDNVAIYVADNGPGIPAEQHDAIFEAFVQLGAGLANRGGGVGLGLAISRDIARSMHGDLTVESTLGVGSRFTLTLPRPTTAV
ncbi:MAG: ATP-binding region ATPase domain protein [Gemmatimonadetes bacterium]|nr:ATP-binding region ATPase domain protein [Gemmatimonadota bacterium]